MWDDKRHIPLGKSLESAQDVTTGRSDGDVHERHRTLFIMMHESECERITLQDKCDGIPYYNGNVLGMK